MPVAQWTEHDDGAGYTASGPTIASMPPGLYDVISNQGQIVWVPVRQREDKILRFPESASKAVVEEIERFWEREEAFKRHGLPFKRGILLHGPPGSGKSCTLQLLAKDVVQRGGMVIMFDGASLFLGAYRMLRDVQPETPVVVLMEDLDAIIKKSNESTILNLLDGAEMLHKVVFVATTNYPELLGPRIINRPSRFDRRILIPHPNEESRRMYIESLVKEGDDVDVERIVKDTGGMSLAHVKELFVSTAILGADHQESLDMLRDMKATTPTSISDEEDALPQGIVFFHPGGYA